MLSKKEINFFLDNGYLIIKDFYPKKLIINLKKDIFNLSQELYFFNYGNKKDIKFTEKNFDYYLALALKNNQREFVSKFYDIIKKFDSIYDFSFYKKNKQVAKKLLKAKNVGTLIRACGIRMDYPNDKVHLTQLHQDYIQNLGSPAGLVFYSTIRKVTKKDGPVLVYPKSNKLGISKVKIHKKQATKSRSYILDLPKNYETKTKNKSIFVNVGDLVIFDFLLLHKSSYNYSNNIRWSIISRFFSFDSDIGKKNMFVGGLQENIYFENVHPEKVTYEN